MPIWKKPIDLALLRQALENGFFKTFVGADGMKSEGLVKAIGAANLGGSMRVCDEVAGMRLLLLDDVVTTGSSVREAIRAMESQGVLDAAVALLRLGEGAPPPAGCSSSC